MSTTKKAKRHEIERGFQQIMDAILYGNSAMRTFHKAASPAVADSRPGTSIDPEKVRALPTFSHFTTDECSELLDMMVSRQITRGNLLFKAGDPGNTCFVIVHGKVDVSIEVRGRDQLLARLHEGAVLGQVALIEGGTRTATCRANRTPCCWK